MGKSKTVHVLGFAPCEDGHKIYTAMSKVEIAQVRELAKKDGLKIKYWLAQTKTGAKILGYERWEYIDDLFVKAGKTVTCPVCNGIGQKETGETMRSGLPVVISCPICNSSGICKPGYEKNWQEWQIKEIRKRFELG